MTTWSVASGKQTRKAVAVVSFYLETYHFFHGHCMIPVLGLRPYRGQLLCLKNTLENALRYNFLFGASLCFASFSQFMDYIVAKTGIGETKLQGKRRATTWQ